MDRFMRPLLEKSVVVYYFDDTVIDSHTMEEHIQHLSQVFGLFEEYTLYARPSKCISGIHYLRFYRHLIGSRTIRPLASKIAIIRE